MMDAFSPGTSLRTTDGTIALSNLEAQVDGLERAIREELTSHPWAQLIDLLTLRAQIIGRIADYERAAALAEQRVHEAPADGFAFLARARTRASLHRFDEALADLDTAARLGLSDHELEAERAAVLQAVGLYDEAMTLRRRVAERHGDFEGLAGLASLHAELGEIAIAERLFDECYKCFRGVSPFPIAQLEFQRGHMWFAHGDLDVAYQWFDRAWRRLPAYAQAEGHLAEVEYELCDRDGAIARLRRLAFSADDPDYAAQLARMLVETGLRDEADKWRKHAQERYEQLVARHPAAFADHAAEFWLSVGDDPPRALSLAELNLKVRRTPKARALFSRAIAACEGAPGAAATVRKLTINGKQSLPYSAI
jgi:tetratricopeptide (TPR) repeat protein